MPLNLSWPADFERFGRPGYETEWRTVGRQIVEHFRQKGWTRTQFDMFLNHKQRYRFFPWDCEEVRFPPDNAIHYTFRDLWRGTYDWPSTKPVRFAYALGITWLYGIDTVSPMRDFVDVWVGSPGGEARYHDQLADLHARGQAVWVCGTSPGIDEPLMASNWWPLMTWMRGVDGFLPWLSLGWGAEPLTAPPQNGRTTLMYPGARFGLDGPVVSQRLKVLRNAMQTIERFDVAAGRAGRETVERRVLETLGLRGPDALMTARPVYPTGARPPAPGPPQASSTGAPSRPLTSPHRTTQRAAEPPRGQEPKEPGTEDRWRGATAQAQRTAISAVPMVCGCFRK